MKLLLKMKLKNMLYRQSRYAVKLNESRIHTYKHLLFPFVMVILGNSEVLLILFVLYCYFKRLLSTKRSLGHPENILDNS